MAHMMPPPPGRMPSSQRKMQNGPKMGSFKRPMKSNNKKVAKSTHTGDVVSDESDPAAEEGGSTAIEDDDEADAYALSGAKRGGSMASARLAGLSNNRAQAFGDDQAVAGAKREGSDAGSDDYDYGVVEDVSESESEAADDDERSIRKAAERDLVAEFERLEDARPQTANSMSTQMTGLSIDQDAALARRLSLQSEDSNLEELDFSQDPFAGLPTNDSLYLELFNEADNAWKSDNLSSWRDPDANLNRENSVQSNGNEKKVRFVETPASSRSSSMSSEDEDDPRNSYPDLFDEVDDNMSRSQFLMEIEMAVDDDNESTYDYESFTEQYETGAFGIDQGESDSESEMSDSTDDGETTDEEDADEQLARVRAMQRRNGTTPVRTPASTPGPSAPSTPVTGGGKRPSVARLNTQNRKPKTGTFKHDPTRASIMADTKGSGVKLVCPTNPPEQEEAYWERARQAMGSRDGSPGGSVSWTRPTPRASTGPKRPLTAKSTLGTMFDGNLDFLRDNDECGIAAELTMPSRTSSLRSSFTSTNTPEEDEDSDDSSNIHMEDFVQMSDSDSEMDEPLTSAITSPTGDSNALGHLQQRGLVSSFRNNQHLARQVSSLPAHPTQRAQTSEANALQKGRRGAANTPMTPARKKNLSQDLAHTGAGVKKASASPLIQKHRRSRGNSLSQTLAIDRFSDANRTQ